MNTVVVWLLMSIGHDGGWPLSPVDQTNLLDEKKKLEEITLAHRCIAEIDGQIGEI